MPQTSLPALAAIGARLRVLRREKQLSLADIAARARISAATLSRIENGKQPLGVELFLTLSALLDAPADTILAAKDEPASAAPPAPKPPRERRRPLDVRLEDLVQQVDALRQRIVALRDDLAPSRATE